MVSPLLAGIKISPRFAEALGMAEEKPPVIEEPKEDKFLAVNTQMKDLEASVYKQLEELKTTGYERLPGAAGKRDSDPGEPFLQKMMKSYPEVFKADPEKTSEMQQFENRLRHKYKMKEDDIQQLMMPMWSTILHSDKPTDDLKKKTYQNKLKSTEAPDPLLTAVEKLAGMIEGMNKPKTIIRDKDGKIMGVA